MGFATGRACGPGGLGLADERERGTVTVSQKNGHEGEEADGRRRRSQHSREAIVSAMFELIGEGDLRPSAQRIADRAGVGIRTVFRHFDEMDRLFAEMSERLRATIAPLLSVEVPTGSVARRASGLVAVRCDIYERIGPYKRSGNLQRFSSPYLRKAHRATIRDFRIDLERWLPEVGAATPRVANAIEAMVSFECWDRLRTDQKLNQKDTREAMETAVGAVVAASLKPRA